MIKNNKFLVFYSQDPKVRQNIFKICKDLWKLDKGKRETFLFIDCRRFIDKVHWMIGGYYYKYVKCYLALNLSLGWVPLGFHPLKELVPSGIHFCLRKGFQYFWHTTLYWCGFVSNIMFTLTKFIYFIHFFNLFSY